MSAFCSREILDILYSIPDELLVKRKYSRLIGTFLIADTIENSHPDLKKDIHSFINRAVRLSKEYGVEIDISKSSHCSDEWPESEILYILEEQKQLGSSKRFQNKALVDARGAIQKITKYILDNKIEKQIVVDLAVKSDVSTNLVYLYDYLKNKYSQKYPNKFNHKTTKEKVELISAVLIKEYFLGKEVLIKQIPIYHQDTVFHSARFISLCMDNQKLIEITKGDKNVLAFLSEHDCLEHKFLHLLSNEDKVAKMERDFGL